MSIKLITLLNTSAIGYSFINEKTAYIIYNILGLDPLPLINPRPLRGFNRKLTKRPITYTIYPTLIVKNHSELIYPILITTLGQYNIILGKP